MDKRWLEAILETVTVSLNLDELDGLMPPAPTTTQWVVGEIFLTSVLAMRATIDEAEIMCGLDRGELLRRVALKLQQVDE